MLNKGIRWGLIGFVIFELLSYFTSLRYEAEPQTLAINIFISLVIWLLGGWIFYRLSQRKAEK